MKTFSITNKLFGLAISLVLIGSLIPASIAKGATASLTLKPVADATVKASSPSTNYGTTTNLSADGSPVIRSYMRFNVTGLNGAAITSAKLRMYAYDGSSSGISLSKVSNNTWSETGITFSNAPAVGSKILDITKYADGVWLEKDITGQVTAEGLYSFVLTTGYDTTTAVNSRESGANAPQLVLTLSTPTAPTATTAPTQVPTRAPTTAPTAAPTAAPTSAPINSPVNAPSSSSFTLKPVADATVNASSPSTNYGTTTNLSADGSPVIRSYMRFNVTGLNGAAITSAKLRMYAYDGSSSGISLSKVSNNTWSETGITYSNAPAVGSKILDITKYADGVWLEKDITGQVTAEGLYSFALTTGYDTTTAVNSRESGANAPQLVLTISSSSAPAPTTAPTTAPTIAPTTAPTTAPTAAPTTAPTSAPTQSSSNPKPVGVTGTWNLKFSDEFNGNSLDLNKWEPNWLAGNNTTITKPVNGYEQSCYDPAQISVGAFGGTTGAMKMSAVARSCKANNGTTYPYASALVNSHSHYTFTYGYMEARVWLDGSSTVKNWPAFWADGSGTWPTTGEIDVMEGLGGTPAWHFHWGTSSSPQQVGGYPSMSTKTGWHTFAADWEPGVIKFYYDGVYAGQVTNGVTSAPMFIILNLGVSSTISGPIQVPSDFLVDYVRVWQH